MLERLRELFPIKQRYAYFMSSASGPIPMPTYEAADRFNTILMEEGSAAFGAWMAIVKKSRESAAKLLDCDAKNVAFVKNTGSGLWLASRMIPWEPDDEIILPEHEFPSNVFPWLSLEPLGVKIKWLPSERDDLARPLVTPKSVASLVTEKTKLLAVSFVQYDDGCRRDMNALGEFCKDNNITFVVDAIQGLGALPFSATECHADFVAAGSQKWLLSPPGVGLLYVKQEWLEEPWVPNLGWLSVDDPFNTELSSFGSCEARLFNSARRFEEGTPNFSGIAALGASIDLILEEGIENISKRIHALTNRLAGALSTLDFKVVSPRWDNYWSGIVSFHHPRADSEQLYKMFLDNGVLTTVRHGWVRVAVHFFNDETEVDRLIGLVKEYLKI
jgi:selenocysteine lyase/cysteine desulfurase